MKNQHKNIDEQLRELENHQLPDLSQIDKHWKAFSSMPSSRPFYRRPSLWVASLIVLVVAVWILLDAEKKPKDLSTIVAESVSVDTVPKRPRKTASPSMIDSAKKVGDSSIPRKIPKKLYSRKVFLQAKNQYGRDTVLIGEAVGDDSVSSTIQLEDFLSTLGTPSQNFVLDNRFDTILVGNSGSLLSIPANSFGENKQVTIVLTEFYTKEEFVKNRLVTMAGDQTLVSGGMVKIEAFENGKPIGLSDGKKIKWYVANKGYDLSSMQLFEGRVIQNDADTGKVINTLSQVDWLARSSMFFKQEKGMRSKVLDVRNTPFKTKTTAKGETGYFVIDPASTLSRTELSEQLKTRYSYEKIVLRSRPKKTIPLVTSLLVGKKRLTAEAVGDSTWLDSAQIRLTAIARSGRPLGDTLTISFAEAYREKFNMPVLNQLVKDRFGVELNRLGWINCDRFYKDPRPRHPLYVEIGDTAANYYTTLVFKNLNVTLRGRSQSQSVVFQNIPEGEEVMIVSVGVLNGKIRSTVEHFVTKRKKIVLKEFKECSSEEFKEKLLILDK